MENQTRQGEKGKPKTERLIGAAVTGGVYYASAELLDY